MTPNDVIKFAIDHWWVVPLILWVCVALGVTGSVLSFLGWVKKGVSQIFNPKYLILLTIVLTLFAIIASMVGNWITGVL